MICTAIKHDSVYGLKKSLRGRLLFPGQQEYEDNLGVLNGAVCKQPAFIVMPETVKDIQATIGFANRSGLPVSVSGDIHDWTGRGIIEGGIMITLRQLKQIDIDEKNMTARVVGAITAGELIAAAAVRNLVAVAPEISATNYIGFTLDGGYSPLSSTYGLAIDNLVSAELILADGSKAVASDSENPELFWAIKGGGANLGIVTSITVRLHPAKPLQAGIILFPWQQAETVLRGYAQLLLSPPDELSVQAGMISDQLGNPVLYIAPSWYGDIQSGEQAFSKILKLGNPLAIQINKMNFRDIPAMFDPLIEKDRHYYKETNWVPVLTEEMIQAIVKAGNERTSPLSMIVFRNFHGAPSRIPLHKTAFGLRQSHIVVEIIAAWEPAEARHDHTHKQWAGKLLQALSHNAFPGGYTGLLHPEDLERITEAYGQNFNRLRLVKHQYDRRNLFAGPLLQS